MIRITLILVLSLAVLSSCDEVETLAIGEFDEQEILSTREDKDAFFGTSDESPLPPSFRQHFDGLSYFAPSSEFVIEASYEPFAHPDTIVMLTTTAQDVRQSLRVGTLSFTVGGKQCKLYAYQTIDADEEGLFVPFQDATTGHETYEVGRYLQVTFVMDSTATIDFNLAYNPYCAYNDAYSCPLVPKENRLPVAIRAGERTWK